MKQEKWIINNGSIEFKHPRITQRILAGVIDLILIILLYVVIFLIVLRIGGMAIGFLTHIAHPSFTYEQTEKIISSKVDMLITLPYSYILTAFLCLIFVSLFESSIWQATPGKKALKMYITDAYGTCPSFLRVLVRNILKIFSVLFLGGGYISILFNKSCQAWHDKLTNTFVVNTKK